MPLPQPTYPAVVPSTFLTPQDRGLMSLGLELYARYHPAALEMQKYQALLEEEEWQNAEEAEKVSRLVAERQSILELHNQLRAARVSGAAVGSGRSKGGASNAQVELAKLRLQAWNTQVKETPAAQRDIRDEYVLNPGLSLLNDQIVRGLKRQRESLSATALANEIKNVTSTGAGATALAEAVKQPTQMKAMAADLWRKLEALPNAAALNHQLSLNGVLETRSPASIIDSYIPTGGWLAQQVESGVQPTLALDREMTAALSGGLIEAPDLPELTPGGSEGGPEGGAVDPQAELESLFEDRISALENEIASRSTRSSPMARAARRLAGDPVEPTQDAKGLPILPTEALQAAAQHHPVAGQALPHAIKRVQDGGGVIEPKDDVEKYVQNWITASDKRDFRAFWTALTSPPGQLAVSEEDRIKAAAYYGAYYYAQDMRNRTTDPDALRAASFQASRAVRTPSRRGIFNLDRRQRTADTGGENTDAIDAYFGTRALDGPLDPPAWGASPAVQSLEADFGNAHDPAYTSRFGRYAPLQDNLFPQEGPASEILRGKVPSAVSQRGRPFKAPAPPVEPVRRALKDDVALSRPAQGGQGAEVVNQVVNLAHHFLESSDPRRAFQEDADASDRWVIAPPDDEDFARRIEDLASEEGVSPEQWLEVTPLPPGLKERYYRVRYPGGH